MPGEDKLEWLRESLRDLKIDLNTQLSLAEQRVNASLATALKQVHDDNSALKNDLQSHIKEDREVEKRVGALEKWTIRFGILVMLLSLAVGFKNIPPGIL